MCFGDLVLKYMEGKDLEKYADDNCPSCKGGGYVIDVNSRSYDTCFCAEKSIADELIDKLIEEYRELYERV